MKPFKMILEEKSPKLKHKPKLNKRQLWEKGMKQKSVKIKRATQVVIAGLISPSLTNETFNSEPKKSLRKMPEFIK